MEGQPSTQELVEKLRRNNPDISAAVVATADGFSVAADSAPEVSADLLAALGADLLARSSRSAEEFGRGQINELYMRCDSGYLIVVQAGSDQALVCLATPAVTLGLLLVDVRRAAGEMA